MSDTTLDSSSSEDPSQNATAPVFYDRFNFEDGNIIISASGTLPNKEAATKKGKPVTRYFRVHKSILRIHSKTFADLFEVPQPDPMAAGDQRTIDGLAVVHLHDELADLVNLLTVLYYGDTVPQTPLYQETFDFLAPVVRLADKYDMENVVAKYLPRIRSDWPTSLEKWDLNEGQVQLFDKYQRATSSPEHADDCFIEPCAAIRFARQQGIDSMLPSAFYHLSRLPPRDDSDDSDSDSDSDDSTDHGRRTARWSLMTTEDYRTLQRGQHAIRAWVLAQTRQSTSNCHVGHTGEGPCQNDDWWARVIGPQVERILLCEDVDVLAGLAEMTGSRELELLCVSCRIEAQELPKELRSDFWERLPKFFGLEGGHWGDEDVLMH